jgi:hypothetical protein
MEVEVKRSTVCFVERQNYIRSAELLELPTFKKIKYGPYTSRCEDPPFDLKKFVFYF